MNDIMKTSIRITLLFMAVWVLLWAIVPEWRVLAAGVVLGAAASALNAILLRRRVELLGDQASADGKRRMGMGFAGRLATVLLAVMTAYRFPDMFLLPATLVACFFVQLVVPIAAMYHNKRHEHGKG